MSQEPDAENLYQFTGGYNANASTKEFFWGSCCSEKGGLEKDVEHARPVSEGLAACQSGPLPQ